MIVYRVEHRTTRLGPWRNDRPAKERREASLEGACPAYRYDFFALKDGLRRAQDHPTPGSDPLLSSYCEDAQWIDSVDAYVFGFERTDQLLEWFGSRHGRMEMRRSGMVLRSYEVSRFDVLLGEHQLMFMREQADEAATYDLVELVPEDRVSQSLEDPMLLGWEMPEQVPASFFLPRPEGAVGGTASIKNVRLSYPSVGSGKTDALRLRDEYRGRFGGRLLDSGRFGGRLLDSVVQMKEAQDRIEDDLLRARAAGATVVQDEIIMPSALRGDADALLKGYMENMPTEWAQWAKTPNWVGTDYKEGDDE